MALGTAAAKELWKPPRFILGCWQLSSGHHGPLDEEETRKALELQLSLGVAACDCGDIYSGVEKRLGDFIAATARAGGEVGAAAAATRVHTKLVPDLERLSDITPLDVEVTLRRSIRRLRLPSGEPLELMQLHWWDLRCGDCAAALRALVSFTEGPKPLVRRIGLTNFGMEPTKWLLDMPEGASVASTQVQFSLLDQRVAVSGLLELCQQRGVAVLCYGVLAGGLLSERWLGAEEPPEWTDPMQAQTRSLTKYILVAKEGGSWEKLQELLRCLHGVAQRRSTSIAQVAIAWALAQPAVASVIIGLPRGSGEGLASAGGRRASEAVEATDLVLAADELQEISCAVEERRAAARRMGDFYEAERNREGEHGRIMRYNLSRVREEGHAKEVLDAEAALSSSQGVDTSDVADARALEAERLTWEADVLLSQGRGLCDASLQALSQARGRLNTVVDAGAASS